MKKLALFVPTLYGGGAERVMVNLASGLVSLGYNVNLIVADTHGVFLSQIDPAVHIIDLKQPRVLFALPKLIGYLIKEKPIGLISALDYANIIAIIAGRLTQVPVVISEHSTHSNALENVTGIKAKILPYLMQFFYPNAHAVVAVSDGVAKDLSSALKLDIRTISVIPNPVITSDLPLKAAMIPKHPWLANKTVPLILAVGRLSPPKDFSTLLHAFSLMIHTRDAKLIILGEGEDRSPLEQLIHDLDLTHAVLLPGFSDNPYSYMAHSDLFVLSSAWEGFGNVLVEALSCGCPVVSTDCPSGPREILENGRWGRLVPPKDPEKLADAMMAELISPRPKPTASDLVQYTLPSVSRRYAQLLDPKKAS